MRQNYRELTAAEKAAMQKLKTDLAAVYDDLSGFGSSRELSVAKTKIEEAVMWAVKHITGAGIATADSGDNGPPPHG
jgi:hypothetical protein